LKSADLGKAELATSYYNYGRALQLSNNWDSAQQVYANALQIFAPPTDDQNGVLFLVFNLPLHIHRAFSEARDSANARLWFNRALQYYQRWSSTQGQPTALSTMSLGNLARLYEDAGMWDRSAAMLLTMKDPSGDVAAGPKLHLADIYVEHLNRPDSALVLYDQLSSALQGLDTIFRPALMVKKSLTYIAKKEYTKARELLTRISAQWRGFYAGSPSAQFNKAKCFEMENKWDRAETEYRFLIDNYPGSEEALSTYLYLAQKAAKDGRTRESQQWYERAEKDFDALAVKGAGTAQEAIALYFKADLYRLRENWSGAAATLQRVFERFPQTDPGRRAAMMAVDVYRQKLDDNRRADSLVVAFQQAMMAVDESAHATDLSKK
jgi:tetratricopeptide (TPR) repeat protein